MANGYTGTINVVTTIAGETATQAISVDVAGREGAADTVPAAKVGQLTTRTDSDTGTVTMVSGHGFATSDKIDLFWDGGSRRNMTATVTVNSVVLDGGEGDNLPTNLTAVTAMKQRSYGFTVNGNDMALLQVKSAAQGWIVFVDAEDAEISTGKYRFDAAGGYGWAADIGTDNPFTDASVAKVKFTHAASSGAQKMRAEALIDSEV